MDTIARNQASAGSRTKQYEADVSCVPTKLLRIAHDQNLHVYAQLLTLVAETERFEKEVLMKRRTLELLPSARDNIGTLLLGHFSSQNFTKSNSANNCLNLITLRR